MNNGVVAWAIAVGMYVAVVSCSSSAASMFDRKTGIGMSGGGPHGHKRPLIVAHRGASGMLPEHTLEAYREAILQGADFVECDAVLTKDGVLICRHEPDMSNTTNVAMIPDFANKRTTYEVDGKNVTGYFAIDFTLDEIKRLRAIQRLSFRDKSYDGQFQIPTLEEYLDLLLTGPWGREIGFYVETKRPRWHELRVGVEKKMEDELLEILKRKGLVKMFDGVWSGRGGFVESFDDASLKYLHGKTSVPLVQLLGEEWPDQLRVSQKSVEEALEEIAKYANALGPSKVLIAPVNRTTNKLGEISELVEEAHARQLQVHPWVFRNEYMFLAFNYGQDPFQEYSLFVEKVGVDGFFTDFPATAACYLDHVSCSSGHCAQDRTRSDMHPGSQCMFGTRKMTSSSHAFFMPLHCLLLLSALAAAGGIVAAFTAVSFWRSSCSPSPEDWPHVSANGSSFSLKNALCVSLPLSSYRTGWERVKTVDDTPNSVAA